MGRGEYPRAEDGDPGEGSVWYNLNSEDLGEGGKERRLR